MAASTQPPGPSGLPVLGVAPTYLRDPLSSMERWAAEHGDVVHLQFPGTPTYMVTDPDLIQQVLVTESHRFERGDVAREVFGDLERASLSVVEGEAWRRQRQVIQPAFARERVEGYADTVTRCADDLVEGWDDGDRVLVRESMSEFTLRALCRALFDLDVRSADGDAIREAVAALHAKADYASVSAYVPDWVPTPTNRRFARATQALHERVEATMAERRAADDPDDDLLSRLLEAGEATDGLSDEAIRDNVVGLLLAGHDTTAVALTCAWHAIAGHPDVEHRLHEEVDEVLGDDRPAPADLDRLPVVDRVVRETLRLYPPTPAITRQPTADVTLGGYEVPAGATVLLPQWVVHRDDRFFDDPAAFRPSRWTDGLEESLPTYAYFPYGGGPRHCVGMRFAAMELRLALAAMAHRVRLEGVGDEPLSFGLSVSLRPERPVEMTVRER